MTNSLDWPQEAALRSEPSQRWLQPESNICLDFHGDPVKAGLVVFSDGNHHMALEASVKRFIQQHPEVVDIFYATTPPGVIVNLLKNGQLVLGNLSLSRLPNVFISPPDILDKLQADGYLSSHRAFMQSKGNALLVRKSNPKNIQSVADLLREDVRLFISNPVTERASYEVYEQALLNQSIEQKISEAAIKDLLNKPSDRLINGERIHHREAPQCLFDDKADVAIIYHHLALRYTHIFPEHFEFIPLGNDDTSVTNTYHIGLLGDGGRWGQPFHDFMFSDEVTELYREHGLQRPIK